ncbi:MULTISPECIES: bestrophin-like domain [unclassified Microbacterium]|uniref:bestrophin-like domain n=1 Tax=unclassified Microbacterium TaxID=2609290 RepID=UPI00301AEE80
MIVSLMDAPLWLGLTVFCVAFVGLSCLILLALRRWVARMAHEGSEWDRVLSYAVGAYGVFYGVTLALIAAASYATYADVDQVALDESSSIAVLYRSAENVPEPQRTELREALIAYTTNVVEDDWPQQARLIEPVSGDADVTAIQQAITGFIPADPREINVQAQTLQSFDTFVGERRQRIEVTDLALPSILWTVLWVGAILNAILLSLIQVRDIRIHLIMVGLIAVFVALLLYAIAGFDRPYSGPIAVTPGYYQSLLDGLFQRVP